MFSVLTSLAIVLTSLAISSQSLQAKAKPSIAQSPIQIAQATPTRKSSTAAFIPNGWTVEKEISGDLNSDGTSDRVLQIANREGNSRSLIVLFSTSSGWKQIASAPQLLLCTSCAGVMGTEKGGHIQLQIQDSVLVVKQLAGSRSAVQIIHRFWVDRNSRKLVCIGEDVNPYDRANGNSINDSRNFLTGKRIIEEYRGRIGKDPVRRREGSVSRQLRSIESIDIEVVRKSAIELP